MLISIIVPVYNCERYIDIMKMNFNQYDDERFELIFVDDGSKDNSLELLKKEFPFSRVFHQKNQGSGIARNLGIERAKGEYIAFCDVDDYLHRDVLEELVNQNYDVDIVQAVAKRCFYNNRKKKVKEKIWKPLMFEMGDVVVYPSSYERLYLDTIVMSKIFKSDFLKASGITFPTGKYEDKKFLYYLYKLQPKIAVVNKYLYEWNVFKGSGSQTNVKDIDDLHQRFKVGFEVVRDAEECRNFLLANLINHDFVLYAKGFSNYDEEFKRVLYSYVQKLNEYSVDNFRLSKKGKFVLAESYEEFIVNYQKMNEKKISLRTMIKGFKYFFPYRLIGFNEKKDHWVFCDRTGKASDNAEALYKYIRKNNLKEDIYFVVEKNSKDYLRLMEGGFKILEYGSLSHFIKQYTAKFFITSHINNEVIYPWKRKGFNLKSPKFELIFLQHGVTRSDLSSWFNTKKIRAICTSTVEEYERMTSSGRYIIPRENVKLTGLARHDLLHKDGVGNKVLIFPTWRSFLEGNSEAGNSTFAKQWSSLIEELSKLKSVQFSFVLHPSISILHEFFADLLAGKENIEMINYFEVDSFSLIINEHDMLITDFSSISFDFLYTRKPVVYFKFEEECTHFTNTRPEYDLYSRCGYLLEDKSQVRNRVLQLSANNFTLEEEKANEVSNLFAFNDSDNCARIYHMIRNLD